MTPLPLAALSRGVSDPWPQQRAPPEVTAQDSDPAVWGDARKTLSPHPAEMRTTLLCMPATSVGVVRATVVPSPTWPDSFAPQHFTAPVDSKAQVCRYAAAIWVTPEERPITSTGNALGAVVPSPNWP